MNIGTQAAAGVNAMRRSQDVKGIDERPAADIPRNRFSLFVEMEIPAEELDVLARQMDHNLITGAAVFDFIEG